MHSYVCVHMFHIVLHVAAEHVCHVLNSCQIINMLQSNIKTIVVFMNNF